jgi:hypothetical protein
MVQRTTPAHTPEVENTAAEATAECCHHWVIQPADGPVSNGSCQVCGESREFKNYVESATWGDSRTTAKGSSASATTESTSDDEDRGGGDLVDDEPESGIGSDSSDMESEE